MMSGVIRQLVNAGISYEEIPQDWTRAIAAACLKWLTSSGEGIQDNLSRLQLAYYQGDSEKAYFVTDEYETVSNEVASEDVMFVRGVVVGGIPIPFERLSISDKDRLQCDDCGVVAHCLVDVRDPRTDKIRNLCNNCVTFHDNPRVQDRGGRDKCERCTLINCTHHPLLLTR
jgi:hypothetical protein